MDIEFPPDRPRAGVRVQATMVQRRDFSFILHLHLHSTSFHRRHRCVALIKSDPTLPGFLQERLPRWTVIITAMSYYLYLC